MKIAANVPGAAAFVLTALFVTGCASTSNPVSANQTPQSNPVVASTPATPAPPPAPPIDFTHSGVGIPLDQLTTGTLDREQLRAIGYAAERTLESKHPYDNMFTAVTATPGFAAPSAPVAPPPPPSFTDADTFEQNLQPLFNSVATSYLAVEAQAKARGLPTSSFVLQLWSMYNQSLKASAFPQARINALCLQLIKLLADETDRLRTALESHG